MKEYVKKKKEMFKVYNDIILSGEIVIFGTAFFESYPIYELGKRYLMTHAVYNRSIGGITAGEALEALEDCVISAKPCKLFLALGEHDAADEKLAEDYREILKKTSRVLPNAKVYVLSVPAVSTSAEECNSIIKDVCRETNTEFIELDYNLESQSLFKCLSLYMRDGRLTMCEAFNMV